MKYPIGIQDFEKIRNEGYVYVDKTRFVYDLANSGCYYFLSRPRRFGKSLLLSTMKAYFSGQRELFDGLAIGRLEKEWIDYPILYLDLNTGKYTDEDKLAGRLDKSLRQWEKEYGISSDVTSPELKFENIIRLVYEKTGKQVVILIDEYDKPMLQAMENRQMQDNFRNTLKAFYSVLKSQDAYIKFAFLTGVTKFAKVSVFSDLNNLNDISMDPRYTDICGMTETEIHEYFDESIRSLAAATGQTYEQTCATLKEQYDGYHFCENSEGIYNPFSLLNTFDKGVFRDYWFESGTPTFLAHLLQQSGYNLGNLQNEIMTSDMLGSVESATRNPIPVIYQSGYLTITGYDERFKMYRLGFPNKEVGLGFTSYLLPYFTPIKENESAFFIMNFVREIEEGDPDGFMGRLQTMFASKSYKIAGEKEMYFQNAMSSILMLLGYYVEVEKTTSHGRIDILFKTDKYIYIIEVKLDGTAEEALQQINDKGYAEPFAKDGRKLFKIGVNFSSTTRGIKKWAID